MHSIFPINLMPFFGVAKHTGTLLYLQQPMFSFGGSNSMYKYCETHIILVILNEE